MEYNETKKSKYEDALSKYNTRLNDEEVAKQVKSLLEGKAAGNRSEEVLKFLLTH